MTYQSKSVVEFSRFLTRLSECLEGGAPLSDAAGLIAAHFEAEAAAIQIGGRFNDETTMTTLASHVDNTALPGEIEQSPALRMSQLAESHHRLHASLSSACGHTLYQLTIFRSDAREDFTHEEAELCDVLVAQLRRGIELSTRLGASETENALYSGVLDRLFVGVVILDGKGAILKASVAARELLDARAGLREQSGRLHATSSREDRLFQAAVKTALADPGGRAAQGLSLSKPNGERNLGVIVQPIARAGGDHASAAVAVYIRDPEANAEVSSGLVKQLFDLTPAETAVAHRLTTGLSLEEAACSLNISRNTARAHLRSIFSKSGISRQTELVRLMLNSAAVLGDPAQPTA